MPESPINKNAYWFDNDQKAQKKGPHSTYYCINGDKYIGEWNDNLKHGRGVYYNIKNGCVYQGEWKFDHRDGFGTLSTTIKNNSTIVGEDPVLEMFEKLKKDIGTDISAATLKKVYAGQWKAGKRNGYGTSFEDDGSTYEGQWVQNKKCGWGVAYYADGSRYEGEWSNSLRQGQGVLILPNGDRYEGMWFNDVKEGPGKFIYKDKRRIMQGEWAKGMPKCGTIIDLPPSKRQDSDLDEDIYYIPKIGLKYPDKILADRRSEVIQDRIERIWKSKNENADENNKVIDSIDSHKMHKKIYHFHSLEA
ncbi:histone H3 K4-specific methyltransferase SET7/9 N-terminal domain-containing protein [Rozella allomycis CSF55]|uniref:MORN repeat-containing protein 3 n=1 Tax=Rozella allomycis (strain CSF55) TaxID=988480 RepID=A0A075AS82_ROZAC|nr:hypothetical protein O9G_005395 [Rozella allomycis CSF55]RKP16998.1 histone H3 K4-specific methyltransferase SET7/9 N-terminal domain-containing protein [Rozella allomycis CSF55]|eukprot:EPZ33045.1 hypothetical protein O9G_005395 [Rozella allomycis CSF55]